MAKTDLVADRPVISLRATPDLRDMLVQSARENSRSLSQEVEHRLRASFAGQDQRAMMREAMTEALIEIGTPRFISRFDPSSYDFKNAVWVLADGTLRRGLTMAHETVPADIAAAINNVIYCAQRVGATFSDFASEEQATARAALDAVILKHLRNADEMKAALERIEQGV